MTRRPGYRERVGPLALGVVLVFVLVPILGTIAVSLSPDASRGPFVGGITGDWYVLAWQLLQPKVGPTLAVTGCVLIGAVLVVLPLCHALARRVMPGTAVIRQITMLPLAVPGVALGLALAASDPALRSSGALLVAGQLLVTVPFLVAGLVPALADPKLIEAERVASTLGAGPLRRLATITLPGIRLPLAAALLMAAALSIGEFNLSFFVVPPAHQTAPFALYSAFTTQRLELGAAGSMLFGVALIPAAVAAALLARRSLSRKDAS
jgi:putative spermidine/putrescine transport system permease protein